MSLILELFFCPAFNPAVARPLERALVAAAFSFSDIKLRSMRFKR